MLAFIGWHLIFPFNGQRGKSLSDMRLLLLGAVDSFGLPNKLRLVNSLDMLFMRGSIPSQVRVLYAALSVYFSVCLSLITPTKYWGIILSQCSMVSLVIDNC